MRDQKLWQFQCQKEGSIFYYQHSMKPSHIVDRCPVCGSTRVELTGRIYEPVDEAKSFDFAVPTDAEIAASEGYGVHHDIGGWYVVRPEEEEPEDGSSLGFDGRTHYTTDEEAWAAASEEVSANVS